MQVEKRKASSARKLSMYMFRKSGLLFKFDKNYLFFLSDNLSMFAYIDPFTFRLSSEIKAEEKGN